jgi:hypothetical protein
MAEEYLKRLSRYVRCQMSEIKPERADLWSRHPAATRILLDSAGKPMNSAQFTDLISTRISTMAAWAPLIIYPTSPVGAVFFMIAILRHSDAAKHVLSLAFSGHERAGSA